MQQQDLDSTLLDPKLLYYKHWRCEYIQKRQMHRQLKAILPAFLTNPSSSCKTTSIYLWFLVLLCYSLKLCFLMPIATTWLATSAAEIVCNQFNLLPNQPIYPSIYTSLWSSSIICLFFYNMLSPKKTFYFLCSSLLLTSIICHSKTLLLASELLAPPPPCVLHRFKS